MNQAEKAEKIHEMNDMYLNNFSIEKHREYQALVNTSDFTHDDIVQMNEYCESVSRYRGLEAIDRQMSSYTPVKRKGIFSRIKSWIC